MTHIVFRWLAVAIIACGFASPAFADASLKLSRGVFPPGETFTVTGSGFTPNSVVDIYLDLKQVGFRTVASNGRFSYPATSPTSDLPGPHTVSAKPHSGAGASAQVSYTIRTDWAQWRGGADGRGWNRTENVLNADTVGNLVPLWSSSTSYDYASAPVVSGENFYFRSPFKGGRVNRYDRVARNLVSAISAPNGNGYNLVPAVSGSYLVTANRGAVEARGIGRRLLLWTAVLPTRVGAPVIHDDVVYAIASDGITTGLYAFPLKCGVGGVVCRPLWTFSVPESTGVLEEMVAVGGGRVYARIGGTLFAFKLGCNSGGGTCAPESQRNVSGTNRQLTYANGYVYLTQGPELFVLRADCLGCAPAWRATLSPSSYSPITVTDSRVVVSHERKISVFATECGQPVCSPLWTVDHGSHTVASTTVAGGLIFAVSAEYVAAYPLNCHSGCPSVWRVRGGNSEAGVAVVDGLVYAPDGYNHSGLFIYGLKNPPKSPSPRVVGARRVQLSQLEPDPALAAEAAAAERALKHFK